jgi:CheY-like chemotaxis protein
MMPKAESAKNEKTTSSGFTVLLAEDDPDEIFLFERDWSISGLPHKLRIVRDGEQAIQYLQGAGPYANRAEFLMPDLMLLDLKMPRVDGFAVLQWMQSAGLHHPPVVVRSNSSLDCDKELALSLGAKAYQVKDVDRDVTVKFLQQICERWLPAPVEKLSSLKRAGDSAPLLEEIRAEAG